MYNVYGTYTDVYICYKVIEQLSPQRIIYMLDSTDPVIEGSELWVLPPYSPTTILHNIIEWATGL